MPNKKNIAEVADLTKKVEASSAIYLADYAGLSGNDQVELRSQITQAGGELKITKNRLLALALKSKHAKLSPEMVQALKGPNATLFAGDDAIAPLKALVEFAKENGAKKPEIKAGILGTEALTLDKVKYLASLPGKDQLIAKLLGTLANPARNLVGVLTAPTRNLVYALNAISKK